MKLISPVDEFLIDRTERVCHSFQRFSGKTNFWLYGKCSMTVSYCLLISLMAHFAHADHRGWLSLIGPRFDGSTMDWFFVPFLIFLNFVGATLRWKYLESEAFQRLARGLANPEKIDRMFRSWRMIGLFLLCLDPNLFVGAAVASLVLTACDPLPPCSGRIRELLTFRRLVPRKVEA